MQNLKRIILLIMIFSIGILFIGCDKEEVKLPTNSSAPSRDKLISDMQADTDSTDPARLAEVDYGNINIGDDFDFDQISNCVRIDVANAGSVIVMLRPDVAPATVNNFKRLALEGFYNGLTFHRVIKDFMIEGGEQDTDGVIHDSEMIYGEFADNNFTNNLSHVRGVISMSRKNIPDSASSGFFIVCKDSPQLDSRYAAFGYVISGMDIIDKIQNAEVGENDAPTKPIVIEKIQFMIKTDGTGD